MNSPRLIDCHAHVFNSTYAPDSYFLLHLPYQMSFWKRVSLLLKGINCPELKAYPYLSARLASLQAENYMELLRQYKDYDATIVVIPLDFRSVWGNTYYSYQIQLHDLLYMQAWVPNMKILFHAEAGQKDCYELFERYVLSDLCVGVKIYPPLSPPLTHPTFSKIFAECQARNIPVASHCAPRGINSGTILCSKKSDLSHPRHWEPVLAQFPNLRLNFCHFGNGLGGDGLSGWGRDVTSLVMRYPNTFVDLSYLFVKSARQPEITTLLAENSGLEDRLMYGSDYYVSAFAEVDIESSVNNLKTLLGPTTFQKITETNPLKWLAGRV